MAIGFGPAIRCLNFSRRDGQPMMLAGIWEESEYKGDRRVSFAILTDEPNELIAPYHDRMPLALADDMVPVWLDLSELSILDQRLLLDLEVFEVRPMDRRHASSARFMTSNRACNSRSNSARERSTTK